MLPKPGRNRLFAGALGLLLSLTLAAPATADMAQLGPNNYVAGVPTQEFLHFAAPEGKGRQQMENWCWAACVQMVLNYHGLYVTQEEIVRRVYGAAVDRPANPAQIMAALTGWAPDIRGKRSAIYADPYHIDPLTVINDLDHRWPLIVGLAAPQPGVQGHAYVLTGAYFYLDANQQPIIYRVILRDPYPTRDSRVEMSMEEFGQRLQFASRVYVERL
ncbi:MAG: C39 family peptidase [Armatimonadetes bacterium]|nr:C39 family peptidase [Armatimonadota bacterium]